MAMFLLRGAIRGVSLRVMPRMHSTPLFMKCAPSVDVAMPATSLQLAVPSPHSVPAHSFATGGGFAGWSGMDEPFFDEEDALDEADAEQGQEPGMPTTLEEAKKLLKSGQHPGDAREAVMQYYEDANPDPTEFRLGAQMAKEAGIVNNVVASLMERFPLKPGSTGVKANASYQQVLRQFEFPEEVAEQLIEELPEPKKVVPRDKNDLLSALTFELEEVKRAGRAGIHEPDEEQQPLAFVREILDRHGLDPFSMDLGDPVSDAQEIVDDDQDIYNSLLWHHYAEYKREDFTLENLVGDDYGWAEEKRYKELQKIYWQEVDDFVHPFMGAWVRRFQLHRLSMFVKQKLRRIEYMQDIVWRGLPAQKPIPPSPFKKQDKGEEKYLRQLADDLATIPYIKYEDRVAMWRNAHSLIRRSRRSKLHQTKDLVRQKAQVKVFRPEQQQELGQTMKQQRLSEFKLRKWRRKRRQEAR